MSALSGFIVMKPRISHACRLIVFGLPSIILYDMIERASFVRIPSPLSLNAFFFASAVFAYRTEASLVFDV